MESTHVSDQLRSTTGSHQRVFAVHHRVLWLQEAHHCREQSFAVVVRRESARREHSFEPPQHWEDSTDGVHSFLVFDYHEAANLSHIEAIAPRYDFIWGAGPTTPKHWRKGNPDIIVSQ